MVSSRRFKREVPNSNEMGQVSRQGRLQAGATTGHNSPVPCSFVVVLFLLHPSIVTSRKVCVCVCV